AFRPGRRAGPLPGAGAPGGLQRHAADVARPRLAPGRPFSALPGHRVAVLPGAGAGESAEGMARTAGVAGPTLGRAAAPDLLEAVEAWQAWLRNEKRASPHTLEAYRADLDAFLAFV